MATTTTTEIRNFIGGEERPEAQYGSEPILNPATEEEIAMSIYSLEDYTEVKHVMVNLG
jgi:hypothetical protein